jgi:hypothetical protein
VVGPIVPLLDVRPEFVLRECGRERALSWLVISLVPSRR